MRFAVVGIVNTAIDLAVFALSYFYFSQSIVVANTIAFLIAATNSYVCNKYWTFRAPGNPSVNRREYLAFLAFNSVGLLLSNVTVSYLSFFIHEMIAKLCAISVTFIWNYLTMRRFVFRPAQSIE